MYRVSIMCQLAYTYCYGYILLWLLLCKQSIYSTVTILMIESPFTYINVKRTSHTYSTILTQDTISVTLFVYS